MISSTALPKVTFINAPMASPKPAATVSVAFPSKPASGTMAMAFMANTTPAGACAKCTAIPAGTNTNNTFAQLPNIMMRTVRETRDTIPARGGLTTSVASASGAEFSVAGWVWVGVRAGARVGSAVFFSFASEFGPVIVGTVRRLGFGVL